MSGLIADLTVGRSDGFELKIQLDIPNGRTAALLGPNGSGKSTAVGALAGLIGVDTGVVTLNGRRITDTAAKLALPPSERRIGLMFQGYALFEHMSVEDNVAFGARSRGLDKEASRLASAGWLHAFDLVGIAKRKARTLSGGQAQRVAMARTMAAEPEMVLLDEPLAALDIATRASVRRTLAQNLAEFEGPRLVITHDPAEAFLLADDIHVIENGRITQSGTAAEIRKRPATAYASALVGTNYLTGTSHRGDITLDDSTLVLKTSDTTTNGEVVVSIHPNAVALHPTRPNGSPRNSWQAEVASVEVLGDVARVYLGGQLPLAADVTPGSVVQLGLEPGMGVWVAVKATEVTISPT